MPASDIRAGGAFVELTVTDKELKAGLTRATRQLQAFRAVAVSATQGLGKGLQGLGNSIDRVSRASQNIGRNLSRGAILAGGAIAGATAIFSKFDDQLRFVEQVSAGTDQELQTLNNTIAELGRTTSFTAREVAGAATELGRAGFSRVEIDQTLEGVLALSRATKTDLVSATEIAANALRAFRLSASQAGDVADVLTFTANNSSQSLTDLGEAFRKAAPAAFSAGKDIRNTAAEIATLADVGIKGSEAGTALARAYTRLANPKIAAQVERNFRTPIQDAEGNFRNVVDILADLQKEIGDFGNVRQLGILNEIFGERALRVAVNLQDTDKVNKFKEELEDIQGTAVKTSKALDDGLGGAFRKLLSALEGSAIAIGGSFAQELQGVVKRITEAVGKITEFVQNNRALVVQIVKSVAVLGGLGIALTTAGAALSAIGFTITSLGAAFLTIGGAIAAILNPITLLTVGVGALGAAFVESGVGFDRVFSELKTTGVSVFGDIKKAFEGLLNAFKTGDIGLALEIISATVALTWARTTEAMGGLWDEFTHNVIRGATEVTRDIVKAFLFLPTQIGNIFIDVLETVNNALRSLMKLVVGTIAEFTPLGFALDKALGEGTTKSLTDGAFDLQKKLQDTVAEYGRDFLKFSKEGAEIIANDTDRFFNKFILDIDESRKQTAEERAANSGVEEAAKKLDNLLDKSAAKERTQQTTEQGRGERPSLSGFGEIRVPEARGEGSFGVLREQKDIFEGIVPSLSSLIADAAQAGNQPLFETLPNLERRLDQSLESLAQFSASNIQLQQIGRTTVENETLALQKETAKNTKTIANNTAQKPVFQ